MPDSRTVSTPVAVAAIIASAPPPDNLRQAIRAAERYRSRAGERAQREAKRREGRWAELDDPDLIVNRALGMAAARGAVGAPRSRESMRELISESAGVPVRSLSVALERIIGDVTKPDLLPFRYFRQGDRAGRCVGRIVTGQGEAYGTGFLVAPRLLLTNHHVLPDADVAARSVAQFGVEEQDGAGARAAVVCELLPQDLYVSDDQLDFALVAVNVPETEKQALGWLPLVAQPGKGVIDDCVSIIEHPDGGPKQVAVRNNQIVDRLPNFLHYTTDTKPGASGSPVFNDDWDVVALHHAGVPQLDETGAPVATNGARWNSSMGEDSLKWIANEGVRISSIVAFLQSYSPTDGDRALIDQALAEEAPPMPDTPDSTPREAVFTTHPRKEIANAFAKMAGGESAARVTAPAIAPVTLNVPVQLVLDVAVKVGGAGIASAAPTTVTAPTAAQEGLLGDAFNSLKNVITNIGDKAADVAGGAASSVADALRDVVNTAGGLAGDVVSAMLPGGTAPPNLPSGVPQPGDVLLYQGNGVVSKGIMFFTRSDVSHAALYLGNGMIGEAIGSGLVTRSRQQSFDGANWVIARRLPSAANMKPVLDRAGIYLQQGPKYAYQQIVLLAVLLIVKRVRPAGVLGKLIQAAAAAAATALNRFAGGDKDLMICSEFVYRAYDEASNQSPDPFALSVPGIATREALTRGGIAAGVQEGSLLERLSRRPEILQGAVSPARESLRAIEGMPVVQEEMERRVEDYLEEYFAEVRFGRPVSGAGLESAGLRDEDLAPSVITLATALDAARQRIGGRSTEGMSAPDSREGLVSSLPGAVQRLFKTAADFVTPADLRASGSLRDQLRAH